MMIGRTPVPKREIIDLILRTVPPETTRAFLNIQAETDLRKRLDNFLKHQLVEVLQYTKDGRAALEEAKADYPLTTKPTLYLISIARWPDRDMLFSTTENLAQQGWEGRFQFRSDRQIRSVYMITPTREYQGPLLFLEVPFVYEKKIEYVESDPAAEDYGEVDEVFSLEKAMVWYTGQFKHALLLCGDFSAVKPILDYGKVKLGIEWQLPFLSEEMLWRLAEGATPRSASFSLVDNVAEDAFDAQTITIFDQALGARRAYKGLMEDDTRQQTSGFYVTHPDLVLGGLGVSRQYGRIWTPTKLRKDSLLALSVSLIQKTEMELAREAETNLVGFLAFYRNVSVVIGKKKIASTQRIVFDQLIKAIISARRGANDEFVLDVGLRDDLIRQSKNLDLIIGLEVTCENCGNYLYQCPDCQAPYQPIIDDDQQIVFRCEKHPEHRIQDNQQVACECGGELEITFSADICIFPGADLIKSVHKYLSAIESQSYDGTFLIQGNCLRLVPKHRNVHHHYLLSNFRYWRARARYHQRNVNEATAEKYRRILFRIKEKCAHNDWHPTRETCLACMREQISLRKILAGSTKDHICLPRLLGYAIDEEFDGIHHGHEVADIRYQDILDETGRELNLGIHLKSREIPRKRGLGRSVSGVKELYAQYCHSVYLAAMDMETLDVIGISIPNNLHGDVIDDFHFLANQLGIPLMILAEDDWIKILDAAIEKAEVGA